MLCRKKPVRAVFSDESAIAARLAPAGRKQGSVMDTPLRRHLTALGFALFWSSFMVLWSGDYTIANIVILAIVRRARRLFLGLGDGAASSAGARQRDSRGELSKHEYLRTQTCLAAAGMRLFALQSKGRSMRASDARLMALLIFGLFGDPAAAGQEANDMKLEDAGFVVRVADTPAKFDRLRTLPPRKFIRRVKTGQPYFMYADPDACKCVFVGDADAMKSYRGMRRLPPLQLQLPECRVAAPGRRAGTVDDPGHRR